MAAKKPNRTTARATATTKKGDVAALLSRIKDLEHDLEEARQRVVSELDPEAALPVAQELDAAKVQVTSLWERLKAVFSTL